MLAVMVVVFTRATHLDHVHDVLGVGILLLPQVQHFEFLPDGWVVPCPMNSAERAKRLFRLAAFLSVSKALVLLYVSKSLLFFQTELDVIQGFVRKTD